MATRDTRSCLSVRTQAHGYWCTFTDLYHAMLLFKRTRVPRFGAHKLVLLQYTSPHDTGILPNSVSSHSQKTAPFFLRNEKNAVAQKKGEREGEMGRRQKEGM